MSWQQLLNIRKEARVEAEYWANRPPIACPNDGEPLRPGPAGSENTLFCPNGDYYYPRDYVRPETG